MPEFTDHLANKLSILQECCKDEEDDNAYWEVSDLIYEMARVLQFCGSSWSETVGVGLVPSAALCKDRGLKAETILRKVVEPEVDVGS